MLPPTTTADWNGTCPTCPASHYHRGFHKPPEDCIMGCRVLLHGCQGPGWACEILTPLHSSTQVKQTPATPRRASRSRGYDALAYTEAVSGWPPIENLATADAAQPPRPRPMLTSPTWYATIVQTTNATAKASPKMDKARWTELAHGSPIRGAACMTPSHHLAVLTHCLRHACPTWSVLQPTSTVDVHRLHTTTRTGTADISLT